MNNPGFQQNSKGTLPATFVILLFFCFFGLGLGYVYDQVKPEVYESQAVFRVQRIGIKLPIEDLDLGELIDGEHDHMINNAAILTKAVTNDQLDSLKSLREIPEDDLIPYMLMNLEAEPDEIDPTAVRVSYCGPDPVNAQVVLTSILATYEKMQNRIINNAIAGQTNELDRLLKIADESLIEQKANGVPKGVISRLEARIAELLDYRQSSVFYYSERRNVSKVSEFTILQDPTYGEPTAPSLHCLLIGTLVGLLTGIAFLVVLRLVMAFNSSRNLFKPQQDLFGNNALRNIG